MSGVVNLHPEHVDNEVTQALYALKLKYVEWRKVAVALDVKPSRLSRILHGDRRADAALLAKLGLERKVREEYVRRR